MEALLDFSGDFDVALLDKIVMAFYTSSGPEQQMAQQVLTRFEEHPDSWTKVPIILENSNFPQAKYIGLQILEKLITTRWKTLPEGQRQGIRNFIVGATVKVASDETLSRKEKTYINKLNLALIQILKQEWPHNWPNFITELVESSKTNLSLCENNMVILKLLSEEIFDFSAEQMTQNKIKSLKNQMCGEFSDIFKLCSEVLAEANKTSLIKATLETFLRFLNWIPLGFIFETTIIDLLLNRFLEAPEFRNITLKCLAEIAALQVGPEYDPKFVILFAMVMTSVNRMIPPSTNIAQAYTNAGDAGQELVLNLSLFLSNFLSYHLRAVETEPNRDVLLNAHLYMVKVSQVDEREIFKICLEYWNKLVSGLYDEIQSLPIGESGLLMGLNLGGSNGNILGGMSLRKNIYSDVLSNLRLVVIERMVKPEEVLIVENEEGEIVREFMKESDTIVLYKSMRELLVYLTHLDVADTETILTEKLAKQVDGSEWSWQNLNTLCWAIGSISGAMNEETEKRFLVTVIKDLLGLCEIKRGKDNKAVVASDIMYIVGQYPRFLKAHWKFLKTVVNKLFEFMHETHEGVQDMACDTFIKIAQKCRRHFVMQQSGEQEPFIDEILRLLHRITVDLSPLQVHTFYEAVGYMISAQPNKPLQEKLIAKLMDMPNNAWDSLMAQAAQNMDVLANTENIKILSNVLKTNVSACTSIGSFYLPQIGRIFLDMLGLYKAVSGIISETIAKEGVIATKTPKVRQLRTVKKEILKLMETYIKKAEDLEAVNSNFMPPLLDAILGDYNRNVPTARDAEVLNVMATITGRLGGLLTPQVPAILDAVFEPTLTMINQDFAEFPEHRVGFFKLLRAININCFPGKKNSCFLFSLFGKMTSHIALLSIPPAQFKLFMDSIIWAIKHTMRDIADTGLYLCLEVVNNFANAGDPSVSNAFFQQYFLSIVQDIFFVLTDTDHKSGFKLQSALLARMFELVETNTIQTPLFDPAQVTDPSATNSVFLREYTANLLKTAFPHIQPYVVLSMTRNVSLTFHPSASIQLQTFVNGLSEYNSDINRFKAALRDFLIQLKEFSGDNAELYLEEKEAENMKKAEEERQAAMRIPGMLKPSQLEDKDEEI
ncbi:CRM1 C terminal-domain-containing protein [Lentinula raphanica]|nr:CRM1 C terminal-domain-containing protein [Lentinula raphanica]